MSPVPSERLALGKSTPKPIRRLTRVRDIAADDDTPPASLTAGRGTPRLGSTDFLSDDWDEQRDSGIRPLHESKLNDDAALRQEFIEGARLMGVHGGRKSLKPQQMRLADVCNEPSDTVAVLLPRRSTKTTTLFALALGRCASREEYFVGYTTCTTGTKARDRFRKDIVPVLERLYPDMKQAPFKIRKAGGSERIEFDNGSIFQVLPPQGESFRSDAFDLIIFDEAGEASPEMTEDLMAGALATMDTRPDAQLVVAGTAAKFREGNLLWDTLVDGRDGKASILEYAAPDDTDLDSIDKADPGNWPTAEKLALMAHPGIGTLTTIDVVRKRWEKLTTRQFAEEYLSIFGRIGSVTTFFDMDKWAKAAEPGTLPTMPDDRAVGLAVVVHPDQTCAGIFAAWRDDAGKACLLVVDYRNDTKWLPARAKELSVKMRTAIVYDTQPGPTALEVEVTQRMRPRPLLAGQKWGDVKTAAALLKKEADDGNVRHWDQPDLTEGIRLVIKRDSLAANGWAYGRKDYDTSIIAAEGVALALRWADENPKRKRAAAFAA